VTITTYKQHFPSVQHLPDLPGEFLELKGLLDEPVAALVHDCLGFSVDALPAGKKNLDLGIDLPKAIESLSPPISPA
jgi:hypothetical protein